MPDRTGLRGLVFLVVILRRSGFRRFVQRVFVFRAHRIVLLAPERVLAPFLFADELDLNVAYIRYQMKADVAVDGLPAVFRNLTNL